MKGTCSDRKNILEKKITLTERYRKTTLRKWYLSWNLKKEGTERQSSHGEQHGKDPVEWGWIVYVENLKKANNVECEGLRGERSD